MLGNTVEMGRHLWTRLSQMSFRRSATIRVKGLAIGIEFEDSDAGYAETLGKRCRKKGLLLSSE